MAIFLANEDVEQLISMRDCIDSVEQAYRELGMGRAWNNPRIHTYGQAPDGATHFLKVFTGTVPALGYSILRIDSTMERNESGHATSRKIGAAAWDGSCSFRSRPPPSRRSSKIELCSACGSAP